MKNVSSNNHLSLRPLALANLCSETGLDGRHATSTAARIAVNKVETVLATEELSIWTTACFALVYTVSINSQKGMRIVIGIDLQ